MMALGSTGTGPTGGAPAPRAASARASFVTPFYNAADTLRRCIESVLAQSWANWEYVLADNRSTDDSLAIAEE